VPISDRREIAFDAAAMAAVIACSTRAAEAVGLPGARPKGARFDPHAGTVILLYQGGERAIPNRSGELGALLVAYCLRSGIKVPRNFERRIRVDQDAVVLLFSTNHPVPPTTIAPEQAKRNGGAAAPDRPTAGTGTAP
jgi:hypothetical protein